jgi:hypothetical protein
MGKKPGTVHGKSKLNETGKRQDKRRVKSRAYSTFSLTSRALFTNSSSWQAKQSILHTTVTFYGDCPKFVFDQMAAPIPEIMDGSLHYIK